MIKPGDFEHIGFYIHLLEENTFWNEGHLFDTVADAEAIIRILKLDGEVKQMRRYVGEPMPMPTEAELAAMMEQPQ